MGEDKERREALQRWGQELECEVFVLRARLKLALNVIDAARHEGIGPCHERECFGPHGGSCSCGAHEADLVMSAALDAFDRHTEELEDSEEATGHAPLCTRRRP